MKHWETALAVGGVVCLILGAVWIRRAELPRQDFVLEAGDCHLPVTVFDPPADVSPAGSAIVLHGLSANRRVMTYLSEDLAGHGFGAYLLDLPGHGDSQEAFTFARAQQCATAAVESLIRSGKIDPNTTILVGHSMGAAIAIRIADRDPVLATIAISPAPMSSQQRMPSNLLVFTAQYDLEALAKAATDLEAAAEGDHTTPEDFAQKRAFDLEYIPHATHTSLLFDRRVAHRSELWAMQALFPTGSPKTLALNLDFATYETFNRGRRRLAGALLGLVGLVLLFPLSATIGCRIFAASSARPPAQSGADEEQKSQKVAPSWPLILLEGFVCALAGVLILTLFVPLRFLHIYTGDYLASLLLIWGVLLLLLNRNSARAGLDCEPPTEIAAAVLGAAAFLAVGAWLNWQLTDGWLNGPRWLRFFELLPVVWIFAIAEETVLGPVSSGKRRAIRFGVAMALRLELWLACVLAYYKLANGQVLILLLVTVLAIFSILQRLGTDALRRRTGSAAVAAPFGAILAAWLMASVLPLT
jgi:pimeloyl-ACP methyl ester carboxylesterase